ncbi:hypothetical protein M199_gp246 [Halogranum tailed virus 1]|uniref:Uncharacterized protein n=1 Tax=Halogranum tailed virus 1 TaxID=1273749 RepID=R4T953_9CAUD|nr:hypothetical protein M199_gp246 [Halogranum tailed virus 1]AGM11420.1 hypothetical protein HGTV1_122 [Halogranum tailed virus 1]
MNTMEDLREEVAVRLRRVLHGQEIDMFENEVRIPHMLGITPIGETHDPKNEEHTLLDAEHEFWDDWHDEIVTGYTVNKKIETAIRSLQEDEVFRIMYPYGKEAEVAYVEVDEIGRNTPMDNTTECQECGETVKGDVNIEPSGNHYAIQMHVNCDECGFSGIFETLLTRR